MSNVTVTPSDRIRAVITDSHGQRVSLSMQPAYSVVVSARGSQGPPGTGAEDALLRANLLSEFDDPTKQAGARTNIGIETASDILDFIAALDSGIN